MATHTTKAPDVGAHPCPARGSLQAGAIVASAVLEDDEVSMHWAEVLMSTPPGNHVIECDEDAVAACKYCKVSWADLDQQVFELHPRAFPQRLKNGHGKELGIDGEPV